MKCLTNLLDTLVLNYASKIFKICDKYYNIKINIVITYFN